MFVKNYCFVLIFVFMSGASLPLYSQICKYLWRVRSVNTTRAKRVLFKCIETDTIEHKTQNQTGQNTTLNYLQPHIKIGKQNSG